MCGWFNGIVMVEWSYCVKYLLYFSLCWRFCGLDSGLNRRIGLIYLMLMVKYLWSLMLSSLLRCVCLSFMMNWLIDVVWLRMVNMWNGIGFVFKWKNCVMYWSFFLVCFIKWGVRFLCGDWVYGRIVWGGLMILLLLLSFWSVLVERKRVK